MNLLDKKKLEGLSEEELKHYYKKGKKSILIKNGIFLFLVIFVASIFFLSHIAATSNSKFAKIIQKNSFIQEISQLISSDTKKLGGEKNGRTNILILGMGGEGHDGPYLTDTIIILSYNYDKKETSMVSVPRDLILKTDNNLYKKVNNLYAIGENIEKGYGMEYSKEIISKNIGIPLHYVITIDFYGFKEIVDALGGVNVTIDNSFIDYQYPTYNHKIQTIEFKKGEEHMSGERALQFARSRHGYVTSGNSMEGNDFARSKRQFKIINAIKDKALSFSTITNPTKVAKLYKILKKYIETDIEAWEAMRFVDVFREMDKEKILTETISDAPDSILQGTISTYDGAYILIPRNYNYKTIQDFFINIFGNNSSITMDGQVEENATIEILNGTMINGLASQIATKLEQKGLKVRSVGNALDRAVSTTIIYDLSQNKKPQTLKKIQDTLLGLRSNKLPEEIKNLIGADVDFLIILGTDQK